MRINIKSPARKESQKLTPWATKEDNRENMNLDLEALELSPKSHS